jgi:hypothetical protein
LGHDLPLNLLNMFTTRADKARQCNIGSFVVVKYPTTYSRRAVDPSANLYHPLRFKCCTFVERKSFVFALSCICVHITFAIT